MTTSPCIGLCRLDPAALYCVGCARTRTEIAAWRDAPSAYRARVWAELPSRRERLGLPPVPKAAAEGPSS